MKFRHLFSFVMIVAIMASCNKEEIGDNVLTNFVLKASVENSEASTRAGFDSGAKFYWSKNDKLGVTTTNCKTQFSALTLLGEGGTASGSFSGDIYGTIEGYAVYPHNSNHSMDNSGNLTYMFPATYEYSSVDTKYFHTENQGTANSYNFAMWGEIINGSVGMKHLGGVFMVAFTSIPAEGTFILSADQKINGSYSVNLTSEVPEIKLDTEVTPTNAEKQVVISYKNATEGQTGVFYVPAPTGSYSGVKATLLDAEGNIVKEVACGSMEIIRAYGKVLNFTNGSIVGGNTEEVANADKANEALANPSVTSVKIEEVSAADAITIPAKSSSDFASVPHTIDLSSATLPDGTVTINVAEGSADTKTVEQLTVVVPNGINATGSLQINAPGTTVTIQAADGTIINTIEASTAENTLVIGEGVTIKDLVIKKGNVELYGNVENIASVSDKPTVVKLMTNIDLEKAITITNGNIIFDLNEKILTSAGDGFEVTSGTLTITGNGTVNAGTEGSSWVAVWANGGNAVIENGTYSVVSGEDGSTNDCIYAKGGEITIKGGTFSNVGTYYSSMGGVVINANNTVANSKIIIKGGVFNPAEGCVAYEVADVEAGRIELNNEVVNESELRIAVAAGKNVKLGADIIVSSAVVVTKDLTVDMNGKTLTSAGDGFEVTSGTLTITGNGTVNAGTEGSSWVAVWANGGNAVIENGTYSVVSGEDGSTNDCIYAKGGEITIKGGTFSNVGTYYSSMGGVVINANNTVANSKIIIKGGAFDPAEGCVAYEVADVEAGRIELYNEVVNESELRTAVAAGKNVKLGADIIVSSAVVVTKDLTVDMNGKTLISAGDGFEVTSGTLTITGNGTVNAGTEGSSWVAVWANGGNAVIENGTYSVVSGQDGSTNDCIYAKGGEITIKGGTFSNVGTYYSSMGGVVINANNTVANSKIIINGGAFNPAEDCVAYEAADVAAGRVVLNMNN